MGTRVQHLKVPGGSTQLPDSRSCSSVRYLSPEGNMPSVLQVALGVSAIPEGRSGLARALHHPGVIVKIMETRSLLHGRLASGLLVLSMSADCCIILRIMCPCQDCPTKQEALCNQMSALWNGLTSKAPC